MAHHHTNNRDAHHTAAPRPRPLARLATAALSSLAVAIGTVGTAAAAPGKPNPHREDPAAVKARIAALYRRASELTQTYDAAQEEADRLSVAVRQSQDALARGRAEYAKQEAALGAIAAAEYRTGGMDKRLALMLADHPETFLSNAAMVDRLSAEQLHKVASVVEDQRRLIQLQRTAADQLADLAHTRVAAADDRQAVTAQLHQAQTLLTTLTAPQRRAVANADLGPETGYTGEQAYPATLPNAPAPTTRARTAIEAALADLGKPYVFGAEGPDAFDCSGLMQRVWRQAGVELPRTSSEQALVGQRIPLADIRPGDLVIYYAERSHIGLYIGDGKIVHAPHPGTSVRISPLMSMPVNTVVRL